MAGWQRRTGSGRRCAQPVGVEASIEKLSEAVWRSVYQKSVSVQQAKTSRLDCATECALMHGVAKQAIQRSLSAREHHDRRHMYVRVCVYWTYARCVQRPGAQL